MWSQGKINDLRVGLNKIVEMYQDEGMFPEHLKLKQIYKVLAKQALDRGEILSQSNKQAEAILYLEMLDIIKNLYKKHSLPQGEERVCVTYREIASKIITDFFEENPIAKPKL